MSSYKKTFIQKAVLSDYNLVYYTNKRLYKYKLKLCQKRFSQQQDKEQHQKLYIKKKVFVYKGK